jgi:hypothetical protein
MILLVAIIVGLLAGLIRAWAGGRQLTSPHFRLTWLVSVAFLPQLLAFYLPSTPVLETQPGVAAGLVGSQTMLLAFVWCNRRQPGFLWLGLGLALNLWVIALNGGLMPISPDMASRLNPGIPAHTWEIGSRLGNSKDVILPAAETRYWLLSDRFFLALPAWISYRVAFSLGDMLIAAGAFWLLWAMGGRLPLPAPGGSSRSWRWGRHTIEQLKRLGFDNFPIYRQMSRVFGLNLRKLFILNPE